MKNEFQNKKKSRVKPTPKAGQRFACHHDVFNLADIVIQAFNGCPPYLPD